MRSIRLSFKNKFSALELKKSKVYHYPINFIHVS